LLLKSIEAGILLSISNFGKFPGAQKFRHALNMEAFWNGDKFRIRAAINWFNTIKFLMPPRRQSENGDVHQ
jgi:hypothetical protein